ncbi:MAG: putative transposase, partial [Planctomycetota bacterium]
MGTACTRPLERTIAAFGPNEGGCAQSQFELCEDVSYGGVLCALPALLGNGLLDGIETMLGKINGYYTAVQVLVLVAFMSLCRIKTTEKLRGYAPGEFGKLLGLDRIPEARCLRTKLSHLSSDEAGERWAAHLSKLWMDTLPEYAGTLYVDGHVRVYNGKLSKIPKKYISRQRLCLRGVTGYWVNDIIGRPFFVIDKTTDPGLLKTIENDILPRLLTDVPNQPDDSELEKNPYSCRFILVFDREGYSPEFFKKLWDKYRVACITYQKYVNDDWPEEWFTPVETIMPNGEQVTMNLAEQGSLIGTGKKAVWMREVRKLTDSGHQTSLMSTAYDLPHDRLAVSMFSRWCQENFFKYMMEHFSIDLLQEYGTSSIPETEQVINPKWRELNNRRNSVQNKLNYRVGKFGKLNLTADQMKDDQKWLKEKSALLEEIELFKHELEEIKREIKETPRKFDWSELPEGDKYFPLLPGRKRLVDTIRMIAYRAETAMALLLRNDTVDMAAARRLLQDLFRTDADIIPKDDEGILLIRVHSASRPAANRSLSALIEELNSYEMIYPGTEMKTVYELIG